jgi:L-aminopeptidase/D-esterase-like protein
MTATRLSRRRLLSAAGAAAAICAAPRAQVPTAAPPRAGSLADVGGVRIGHFTDPRRPTGCTVILFDKPVTAGVDYDGAAPGESLGVMLQPVSPLDQIHGILLTGGGPMALGATSGVVRFLEERRIGYDWGIPNVRIPIVVGAVIDDLALGDGRIRVGPDEAYRACEAASASAPAEGSVGAGTGATVGKMFRGRGLSGMKGGVGCASVRLGDVVVAALTVVNAAGDILDWRAGGIVAGARTVDGQSFARSVDVLRRDLESPRAAGPLADQPFRATTLTVVATNVPLSKTHCAKLAMMVNTGPARAINPYHTQGDGDQVITFSTATTKSDVSLTALGAIGAEVAADAIVRAVRAATSVPGWIASRDLR